MKVLFLIVAFFCTTVSFAQKIQQAIETLYKKYPQEKVILTFSKNDYVAGETIYFKAYVVSGYEPSEVSTNLYTELYDKNKTTIRQLIVPLLNGSGQGSFSLPASLEENVYYVRAYTQPMLNYDEAFQYVKPINIYNPYSAKALRPKPVQWTAAAFAEGGSLLTDVPAKLSIRLSSAGTLPQSWKGSLMEKGTTTSIAEIEALNNEIGTVNFTPKSGKEYVVSLKDNAGTVKEFDLPKSSDSGTTLSLKMQGDKIEYTIRTKNLSSNGAGYKLVGTIYDQLVFFGTIKKSEGIVKGVMDVKEWPSSVLRLTLFDEADHPVNERLLFLHQQIKATAPELKTDTISFAAKGYNHWQLTLDSVSWPTYSVQVNDAAYPIENNFLSDLYLTSDFTSRVYNASWYFQDVTDTKKAALDALLISEKWARFNWKDVLNGRFPTINYYPDKYLSYTATVRKGKKLQPQKEVNLIVKADSSVQFLQAKTDSTGSFKMNDLFFTDTVSVFYQANGRKFLERDVDVSFEAMNKFRPYKKAFPAAAFDVAMRTNADTMPAHIKRTIAQKSNELLMNEKGKMMQEVIIRSKAKNATEELNEQLSSGLFSTINETVFDFINQDQTSAQAYSNILEWLQGRVAGFSLSMQDGNLVPIIRGSAVQVFLDEINVDAAALTGLSAGNIAMVKVIKDGFVGSRGGGGAIAVYTRKAGMNPKFSIPSLSTTSLVGYQKHQPFPSPDYSQEQFKNISDQRSVLFLNHLLYANKSKLQVPIKFYNNDTAKRYRVVITGFTADGELIYADKIIQ